MLQLRPRVIERFPGKPSGMSEKGDGRAVGRVVTVRLEPYAATS
jgi:hypothetical protein